MPWSISTLVAFVTRQLSVVPPPYVTEGGSAVKLLMTGLSPTGDSEQPAMASRINAMAENICSLLIINLLSSSQRFTLHFSHPSVYIGRMISAYYPAGCHI
jgi:hypothetical protein